MADDLDDELDDEADEPEAGGDDDELEGAPKKGKKKLLIIIGLALLLVVGGAGAAYFTGLLDPVVEMLLGSGEAPAEEAEEGPLSGAAVFFDLPELLVNLNTGGRKSTFLKIRVALELERPEDIPKVEALMPRVIDNFQVYLRELRVEDLTGSAGMYRLREELLARAHRREGRTLQGNAGTIILRHRFRRRLTVWEMRTS
ncbi:MAG: flagellar basal body-associated FliL family protein [Rhodospirillales bacterium]